jgi:hypothetical protein
MRTDVHAAPHGHFFLEILQRLLKRADLSSKTGLKAHGLILVLEGQKRGSAARGSRTSHEIKRTMCRMGSTAYEIGCHGRDDVFLLSKVGQEATMGTAGKILLTGSKSEAIEEMLANGTKADEASVNRLNRGRPDHGRSRNCHWQRRFDVIRRDRSAKNTPDEATGFKYVQITMNSHLGYVKLFGNFLEGKPSLCLNQDDKLFTPLGSFHDNHPDNFCYQTNIDNS